MSKIRFVRWKENDNRATPDREYTSSPSIEGTKKTYNKVNRAKFVSE